MYIIVCTDVIVRTCMYSVCIYMYSVQAGTQMYSYMYINFMFTTVSYYCCCCYYYCINDCIVSDC